MFDRLAPQFKRKPVNDNDPVTQYKMGVIHGLMQVRTLLLDCAADEEFSKIDGQVFAYNMAEYIQRRVTNRENGL